VRPPSPPNSDALFAYGTLLVPAVVHALLGWSPTSQPAILQDFARFGVRGEAFPGIVPRTGARVEGQLLHGLTPRDWGKLDDFEGDWYERTAVTVLTAEGPQPALVYVVGPEHDALLTSEPWDLETHTQQIIERYGRRSRG
jgi:gamma-glutamylcyclotransferase (GGCT)/AIG2-like uncharacterized protein YtfP